MGILSHRLYLASTLSLTSYSNMFHCCKKNKVVIKHTILIVNVHLGEEPLSRDRTESRAHVTCGDRHARVENYLKYERTEHVPWPTHVAMFGQSRCDLTRLASGIKLYGECDNIAM